MLNVVTGATGQVGIELCEQLLRAGGKVRAVVLPGDGAAPLLSRMGVEVVRGNVLEYEGLRAAFEGADRVYHLAAVVSVTSRHDVRLWRVNVEGPRNAARACKAAGVKRMVYFSSIVVFDPDPMDALLDEDRHRLSPAGATPYVKSKVVGEQVVREAIEDGLDAVIVHPTVVIGPNETHHAGIVQLLFFPYFERRLPTVLGGAMNAVAASDVARGAIAAADHGSTGASYILGGEHQSILGLLERTRRRIDGGSIPRFAIPSTVARMGLPLVSLFARLSGTSPAYTYEQIRQLNCNINISIDKARRELGYDPADLDDALERIHAQWIRQRAN